MIAGMAADCGAGGCVLIARISDICLSLPETAANDLHPPHRGFTVSGKKNFAWYTEDEHGDGRSALCVRAAPGENEALVDADPERFGLPKYVARHGWVSYYLDLPDRDIDWEELRELVLDSYRLQAPRRLTSQLSDTAQSRWTTIPAHQDVAAKGADTADLGRRGPSGS